MKKMMVLLLAISVFLPCGPGVLADWGENTGGSVIPVYRAMNAQQSDQIALIPAGARFSVTGFMGYGWYSVSYQGLRGYIQRGEYLRYDWDLYQGSLPYSGADQGVVICSSVSIREDRNTRATLLATARNGETLQILSEAGEWYHVRHVDKSGKETVGWARSMYIVKNPVTVITVRQALAYSYPSLNAKCVGELTRDTELTVIGQYGDFYCVNLRSASAFVLVKDCAAYGGSLGLNGEPGKAPVPTRPVFALAQ